MRLLQRLAGHQQQNTASPFETEKPAAPPLATLTRREVEILRLLSRGLTKPRISQRLMIGPHTAKVHVQHIIAELEVSDRTQAAVRALELGLLASPEEETKKIRRLAKENMSPGIFTRLPRGPTFTERA